ncbi:glucans biosynthesis glucosyltransferase MdoH [Caulobacter segnis]|uniref:glucans biosynthesis glucosyltransferase MdoH n=1 Tax=Caulobacter segnis TaxID=88688 RepID=UPI00240F9D73|nr:glucans biosynthesis glucosyltransferase MdoH [Caulobacter segnis]MDG2520385.1 glucans biosynthesis glucosyltransferase MdoH [Caulobacter segnis]
MKTPSIESRLPGEAPLAMPAQDLKLGATAPVGASAPAGGRAVLFAAFGVLTAIGVVSAGVQLGRQGLGPVEVAALVLFSILFAWVAFGFVSAVAGFMVRLRDRKTAGRSQPQPILFTRTAVLLPVYNEDPGRILAAVQAMTEDLADRGVAELFDVFILSDTRDMAAARAELAGVDRLRAKLPASPGIYYRRREENTDRKAGNIADWVETFGAAYTSMVVLDADSLMSGETLIELVARMEADDELGLLQTSPELVNAETPFARLQQFASRAYGRMIAAGQDWWSGAEGNFWGHNAIIRTRAFASCAGLPKLPGRKPFGGLILSHDFVEAALLRRGGWKVRMAADLGGSFEETPPTILDMAIRDRRWCQGNLQHAGVLGAAGFHWISRVHLLRGILSYATSPLWLMMLLAGAGVWMNGRSGGLIGPSNGAAWLFGATMAMLIAPKLLSNILTLTDKRERQAFGGGARYGASVVFEIIGSTLVAPVLMLMQSASVLQVLAGRDSGWSTQSRDPGRLSRREAWRLHRGHIMIGLAAAAIVLAIDPVMLWWSAPVYLGLVISTPLAMALSNPGFASCFGLLTTPEERDVPAIVRRAGELRAAYDAEAATRAEIERLMRAPAEIYLLSGARALGGRQTLAAPANPGPPAPLARRWWRAYRSAARAMAG